MIVTVLYCVNATQEPRQHAVPDRPQPGAGRRMVEHPHPARRPARPDALRRISEKPRHRAQHADAAAQCPGRRRAAGAPPLQRTAAARRIRADRARARFPSGPDRAARLGQQALRARGRERATGRYGDRGNGRPDHGRLRDRTSDQSPRICVCPRTCCPERTRRRYASIEWQNARAEELPVPAKAERAARKRSNA